ncbi:hypothetical protein NKG05_17900 [Oerskovia sp. M15]
MTPAEQQDLDHVSSAPTRPGPGPRTRSTWTWRTCSARPSPARPARWRHGTHAPLDEKLRQAYFWVVNHAIISPHYDVEFSAGPTAPRSRSDWATRGRA